MIGKYLNQLDGDYKIYVSADAARTQTVQGITYGRAEYEAIESLDGVPVRDPIDNDLAFVLVSSPTRWSWAGLASLLPRLQYYYPGGIYQEFKGIDGRLLWASYKVRRDDAVSAQGLTGTYSSGRGGDDGSAVRRAAGSHLSWDSESLPLPLPVDASWEGGLYVSGYGDYTFGATGLAVNIDGDPVVDGRAGYRWGTVTLAQGWHQVQAQAVIREMPGDALLAWRGGDEGEMRVIPSGMLSVLPPPSDHGLLGQYYAGDSWAGQPLFERLDAVVDFQWRGDEPLPGGTFSAAWRGQIRIPETAVYRFLTSSDDGSWVYVDDHLVVDNGGLHGARYAEGRLQLSAGWHDIEVRYFHVDGDRGMHLLWAPPADAVRVIPSELLRPPESPP
jgi:fibro-slime domain-containing protein